MKGAATFAAIAAIVVILIVALASAFTVSKDAFETFQRIRHGEISPYAPLALKTFMWSSAIVAVIDVFVSRSERDVGGWVVQYFLSTDGPHFVSYC
jgi:hypothetical protein